MDFSLPKELVEYLGELDRFIEAEIKPLEDQDDNIRFFDHRREHSRTDWDNQGLPREDWEELYLADDCASVRTYPYFVGLGAGGHRRDPAISSGDFPDFLRRGGLDACEGG